MAITRQQIQLKRRSSRRRTSLNICNQKKSTKCNPLSLVVIINLHQTVMTWNRSSLLNCIRTPCLRTSKSSPAMACAQIEPIHTVIKPENHPNSCCTVTGRCKDMYREVPEMTHAPVRIIKGAKQEMQFRIVPTLTTAVVIDRQLLLLPFLLQTLTLLIINYTNWVMLLAAGH